MRILHLVNGLAEGNGITNVVVDLASTQAARGDDVMVVSRRQHYAEFLVDRGVQFSEINFGDRRPFAILGGLRCLAQVIRKFRPDVIHVHTITPLLMCRILLVREPIVATVHNEWQKSSDLMKYASIVVGVSPSVTESMVNRGVPVERIRTVPNGTTGSPRRPTIVKEADLEHPAILYVGSLSERKGTDVLLKSFRVVHRRAPEARLYLVGNNDLPVTGARLRDLDIVDAVDVVGLADPFPYYASADLFVLPSRSEPAALVLLEAMEAGLPVIGSRVGGIADFLDGERGGLTVPREDPEALAEAILRVLRDSSLRESMRRRSLAVASTHSLSRLYAGYAKVYSDASSVWSQD